MSVRGLAAAFSAAVLISGCATTSGVRVGAAPAASAQPSTPAAPVVPPGEVYSPEAAHAKQVAMLSLVHMPAGATELSASPTVALNSAQSIGVDNFLDLPTWYSVPLSATAFAAYLKANPPQGFSGGGGSFGSQVTSVEYGQVSLRNEDAILIVYYQPVAAGQVDVRVDAQVIWLPVKTPAEMIPTTLPRATLTYTGPTGTFGRTGDTTPKPKHAHVVVTGPRLHKLIAILNGMSTESNGLGGCGADFGETATFGMSFGGHKIVYSLRFACFGIYVTSDGVQQPELGGGGDLENVIYGAIGVRLTPIPIVKPQGPPVRTLAKPVVLQHSKVQAQRVGDRALDFGGVLPDDSRQSNSTKTPTRPPYFGKGTLVDRASFWTIQGKVGDLVNWFRAHPGNGNIAAEPYTTKHGIRRLDIEPKDRSKPTTANVWISMVQKGPLVAFRIDAQTAYSAAQAIRKATPVAAIAAPAPDPVPAGLRGEVYSLRAAAVRAHRALRFLTLPPGSRRTAPTALPRATNDPSRHLVYASQWWAVPGTTQALSHFLRTHVPDGFTLSTPVRSGRVVLGALNDWGLPPKTTLTASFVRRGTSVVVRLDGGAVWLSPRSALETIPPSIPVVYLTATGKVDTLRQVTYRGADLSKLVPSLNFDIPAAPGLCKPKPATFVRTATFRIGHRIVAFSWTDDGCNLTRVTVNGRPSVTLVDDFLGDLVTFMMTH